MCCREDCTNLALWCGNCNAEEVIQRGLCHACLTQKCDYCRAAGDVETVHCIADGGCKQTWSLCRRCTPATPAMPPRCRACWAREGSLCKVCGDNPAQNERKFHRCCKQCHKWWFCKFCNELAAEAQLDACLACASAPAVWCIACSGEAAMASGVCIDCLAVATKCQCCGRDAPDVETARYPSAAGS